MKKNILFFVTVFSAFYSIKAAIFANSKSNFFFNPPPFLNLQNFPILFGTYWCGAGNIARTPENLGLFYNLDKCCRSHDQCPDFIEAGATKYGLSNNGLYTRSHCDCDNEFHECLKSIRMPLPDATGQLYFSILGPQCFKKEYPILNCRQNVFLCIEYSYNKTAEPIYQWFDNTFY